ncbi:MAG: ATP-binding protein [Deltaproteobacteria bacterium]|nr:ATP-binding protein [Deltaproteobacteria bacterium]
MGRVIGTQDATPLEFWVWLDETEPVQQDEMIVVETDTPVGPIKLFGMVDIIRARHQGSTFDSDVVEAERGLPVELSIAAHVRVTRIDPEYYYPPRPGDQVRVVSGEEYAKALFMDKMERKFPLGLALSRKEVVYGNLDFLNGRKGAHINISGVSGIATKTTYTTFLLHSLLNCGALSDPANTHAIIFNVKGEDLLFLDKKNNQLSPGDIAEYEMMELPAEAFDSVQFYVPPVDNGNGPIQPRVGARKADEVTPYFWTVRSFCRDHLLRYLFTDASEDSSLLSTLVYQVERRLSEAAEEAEKTDPNGASVFLQLRKRKSGKGEEDGEESAVEPPQEIRDFRSLIGAIEAIASSTNQASGTIGAFMRRLYGTEEKMSSIIRDPSDADPQRHMINWRAKQVTVVSLTGLYEVGKGFVVGSVLQQIQEEKEATGSAEPLCFIVVDELNRYAPRDGWSPIRERLLEIAERGRSSGTILIGAQQTASEVERRIVANPAFRIVGRLDAAEAERAEYGFLPPTLRQRAKILTSGRMIVSQPDIPTPVPVCFPMPAWATRAEEVEMPPPNLKLAKVRRSS